METHLRLRALVYFNWLLLGAVAIFGMAPVLAAEPMPEDVEVHVVGIYEGRTETDGAIHGPIAPIEVNRRGKKVVLVLLSSGPVTWQVSVEGMCEIKKVILAGRKPQAVKGLPAGIPIEKTWEAEDREIPVMYRNGTASFLALIDRVTTMTDQPRVASFHGSYRPDVPIVIDEVQDDPQLVAGYPQPTPVDELPDGVKMTKFTAHHYLGAATAFGEFSLSGPNEDELRPVPRGVARLAYDPEAKQYYGIASHGVAKVDLENQSFEEMEIGLDVPPISWPCELTFDTKRKRLILGSSGGGGYLYAYDPAKETWSVLGKRPGAFDSFAYSEKDDCFYGVLHEHGEAGNHYFLQKVHPDGAVLSKIPLGLPLVPGALTNGPGVCSTSVVPLDGYVAILVGFGGGGFGRGPVNHSQIYLVDLESETLWLTYKKAGKGIDERWVR